MTIYLLAWVVWVLCGVLSVGMCRYDLREYHDLRSRINIIIEFFLFLMGPLGLLTALLAARRPYGFTWRINEQFGDK